MSDWMEGTELNQINAAAGAHPVRVRKELFDLLEYVRTVSDATDGAFDPTFNAFWGLYNFKPGHEREPTEEEIKERLPLVNYKNVVLDKDKQTVFLKNPGMKLGLGGIGQGYGVDDVVKDLKKKYSAGYVDGSGDTYFWGKKPNGDLWTAAVRNPLDKSKDVLRIYGTDFAVTTAGDDEKFFMVGNRRVHHILDPKTGKSAALTRQVTVVSSTATEADAFDTASFVLGPDKGRAVLEKRKLAAVFVTDKGVTITKGLKKTKTSWGEVYVPEFVGTKMP
jgi:thiamine biosynthesis lipoprotein